MAHHEVVTYPWCKVCFFFFFWSMKKKRLTMFQCVMCIIIISFVNSCTPGQTRVRNVAAQNNTITYTIHTVYNMYHTLLHPLSKLTFFINLITSYYYNVCVFYFQPCCGTVIAGGMPPIFTLSPCNPEWVYYKLRLFALYTRCVIQNRMFDRMLYRL